MTVEEITQIVVEVTGVSFDQMKATKIQDVVLARHLLVLLLKEEKYKNRAIAKYVDREHSSISFSYKTANDLLGNNRKFKTDYLACISEITKNDYEN